MAAQSQYDPGFAAFGGGSAGSVLHPIVFVGTAVAIVLTFLLPRKYVIFPLLLGILLTPAGQNLNAGVHFYIYRILVLVGWIRLFIARPESGKFLAGGFTTLDKVFLLWAVYRGLATSLQYLQAGAVFYQLALLVDSVGGYFLFRSLIRNNEDTRRVVAAFSVVALISSVVMLRELTSGQNMMGLLGGIRLVTDVRNGRIRAQGVFQHSILAGSFGATVFPLFLWLWKQGSGKRLAAAGMLLSSFMVYACASSTPLAAWFGTFLTIFMWPLRKRMRVVRGAIVIALLGLAMVMKAPIWYILARIDFAGGSSGWERGFLIDTFMRHIGDWWLIGTHANANWGWDMWDQANQFVSEGESGGILALTCFIAMIVICFKIVGRARKLVEGNRQQEWLFWLLGAVIFAQMLTFVGVDYFDQSKFVWFVLLAVFPAATKIVEGAGASKPSVTPLPETACSPFYPELLAYRNPWSIDTRRK